MLSNSADALFQKQNPIFQPQLSAQICMNASLPLLKRLAMPIALLFCLFFASKESKAQVNQTVDYTYTLDTLAGTATITLLHHITPPLNYWWVYVTDDSTGVVLDSVDVSNDTTMTFVVPINPNTGYLRFDSEIVDTIGWNFFYSGIIIYYSYPYSSNCSPIIMATTIPNSFSVAFLGHTLGTGPNPTYQWDFGDGIGYSNQQNPTYTYSQGGNYVIKLTYSDSLCSDSASTSVWVPILQTLCYGTSLFHYGLPPISGVPHTFYATTSYSGLSHYDFGDGSIDTSNAPTVTHVYTNSGVYYVVRITTDGGCSDTTVLPTVVLPPPSACFAGITNSSSAANPLQQLFTAINPTPATASVWWDFGDGTTGTNIAQNVSHTYATWGQYIVTRIVSDVNGCVDTATQTVNLTVNNNLDAWTNMTLQNETVDYTVANHSQLYPGKYTLMATYYVKASGDIIDTQVVSTLPTGSFTAPVGTFYLSVYLEYRDTLFGTPANIDVDTLFPCVKPGYGVMKGYVNGVDPVLGFVNPDATVYLIAYDSLAGTITMVDTAIVTPTNYQYAILAPYGTNYLIKAVPTLAWPNFMPTYRYKSLYWDSAEYRKVTPTSIFSSFGYDVALLIGTNPGGPGFIGGNVSQGANKTMGVGDPFEGLSILLLNANKQPVSHATTNAQGDFSFPSVAYGSYFLHAEHPGLYTTDIPVTLSSTMPGITQNMTINSTSIFAAGLAEAKADLTSLSLFPNPVSLANSQFTLSVKLDKPSTATVELMDGTGRVVRAGQERFNAGASSVTIGINSLAAGLYRVNVRLEDGSTMSLPLNVVR